MKEPLKTGTNFQDAQCTWLMLDLDSGKKLGQVKVKIAKNDDVKSLKKKILRQEHILYPNSLNKFIN